MNLYNQPSKHLRRGPYGMIAGVATAISEYYGVSLIFIRLVFVFLTLASGLGIVLYLILLVVIPSDNRTYAEAGSEGTQAGMATMQRPKPRKKLFFYLGGVVAIVFWVAEFGNGLFEVADFVKKVLNLTEEVQSFTLNGNEVLINKEEPSAYPKDYVIALQADNDPNIFINKITVDPYETRIQISYLNFTNENAEFGIGAPQQPGAFYLTNPDQSVCKLTSVNGVTVMPDKNWVSPGGAVEFTLHFEPFNQPVTTFNLLEENLGSKNTNYWRFSNIQLN